jgi:hypothetical protein
MTRFSQTAKSQMTRPPARISQIVGERPIHSGPSGFGLTKPQVPERRIPKTISPRPAAESAVPTRSRRTFFSGAPPAIRRARKRIATTTRTSPAKT